MKTTIKVLGKEFEIKAELIAEGISVPHWNDNKYQHNYFKVFVFSPETKKWANFDFYGSYHDFLTEKTKMTDSNLQSAFEMFVSDATYGDMDFEEFCNEFGYDTDSKKAEKVHKECINSKNKLERITDLDLYDLANELREVYNL